MLGPLKFAIFILTKTVMISDGKNIKKKIYSNNIKQNFYFPRGEEGEV